MEAAGTGHRVLVGVDGSRANRPALVWSVAEAKARGAGLVAAYAWHVPPFAYYSPGYVPIAADDLADDGQKLVEAAVGDLGTENDVKIECRTVEGQPHSALRHAAEEPDIDLVVVGKRGHGAVAGLFLGSTSHALSHHCSKPLVIVPGVGDVTASPNPDRHVPIRHIVVGVDGSAGAESALRWAASEAMFHGALLEVVVAWSWMIMPPELVVDMSVDLNLEVAAKAVLSKAVEQLGPNDLETKLTVREGAAPEVLLDVAASADLLVVGTRGLGRAREIFLGSTSHQCAHRSPVPVAIIPSEHKE